MNKSADEATDGSDKRKWRELEELPLVVVRDLEHDHLARRLRIHALNGHGSECGTVERAPHGLWREIQRHFLERKEDATDGGSEGNADASC